MTAAASAGNNLKRDDSPQIMGASRNDLGVVNYNLEVNKARVFQLRQFYRVIFLFPVDHVYFELLLCPGRF